MPKTGILPTIFFNKKHVLKMILLMKCDK